MYCNITMIKIRFQIYFNNWYKDVLMLRYLYTQTGINSVYFECYYQDFFDRIPDCLKVEKELGRKLRGMQMAVISCGYDKELKNGFYRPFIETSKYLGMDYIADIYFSTENAGPNTNDAANIDSFIKLVKS